MKRMLIDASHVEETRVAIVDRKQILEFDYASANKKQIKGNIYLAKVTRVEPSLQAAFVEYGGGRQGFLPFSEIHPDYYQLPVSDRKKLIEEVEREMQEDAEEEEAEFEARQKRGPRKRGRRVRSRRRGKKGEGNVEGKEAAEANAEEEANGNVAPSEEVIDDNIGNKADDGDEPGTQYAKKEEPTTSSEEVVEAEKKEKKPAKKTKATKEKEEEKVEEAKEEEEKKPRKRRAVRGKKRVTKKEAAEAAETTDEKTDDSEEDKRLEVNPPRETNMGAALFSEDKPFEADGKKKAAADDESDAEAETEEEVETIDSEEEAVKPKRKKRVPFFKRYKIQEVVKRGQVVLVQATKEERGNKGASVTTYLSLAGRYCVLMPNSPRDGGVSRKISDVETRKRLKDVMSQLTLAQGMSVIIRTAGIDRSRTEIRRDFDYLVKLWNQIRDGTLSATAPELIYEENNLIKRAIRDLYTSDIDEVLVEGDGGYKEVREFMKMLMPSHTGRVKQYKDDMPLYYSQGIEEQLSSMHEPMAKLKSGGYLIINPTEALISIDVNSGRSTGERNIEETALKTNIEAAHEVARQLRLRDLAGLIVIDFIDMMDSRNRRAVERNLKDALRSDRAKIQVGRISPFGLMEMSRQRLRPSIGETMHMECPTCAGRGLVHAPESLALHIIRTLEKDAVSGRWSVLSLRVSQQIALYVLNEKRMLITGIEKRHGVSVKIEIDDTLAASDFVIDKTRAPRKRQQSKANDEAEDKPKRGRRTRGDRGRKSKQDDETADNDNNAEDIIDTKEEEVAEEVKPKRRGRPAKSKEAEEAPAAEEPAKGDAGEEVSEDLPEFTKRAAVQKKEEVVEISPPANDPVPPPPDTSRPEGQPARKGWWSQMIELD